MLDIYWICDIKRKDKIQDVWCQIFLCGGFLCHVGKHLNTIFLSYKCNFCILNGLLRCFDHLGCLSLFVIFFCIRKLLVLFLFNGNLCNLFSSFEKTCSLFCSKLISWEEIIRALVWLLLYFFHRQGNDRFLLFSCFTFFHSYEKHNCFFEFWWLSVISQWDVVDHWHGCIHYTSYLRKSGLFCLICC